MAGLNLEGQNGSLAGNVVSASSDSPATAVEGIGPDTVGDSVEAVSSIMFEDVLKTVVTELDSLLTPTEALHLSMTGNVVNLTCGCWWADFKSTIEQLSGASLKAKSLTVAFGSVRRRSVCSRSRLRLATKDPG